MSYTLEEQQGDRNLKSNGKALRLGSDSKNVPFHRVSGVGLLIPCSEPCPLSCSKPYGVASGYSSCFLGGPGLFCRGESRVPMCLRFVFKHLQGVCVCAGGYGCGCGRGV